MITRHITVLAAAVLFVGAACAERAETAPPKSPGGQPSVDKDADGIPDQEYGRPASSAAPSPNGGADTVAQPRSEPSPTTAPPAHPAESGATGSREVALRAARSDVDRARRDLEASMSDCSVACRALGSMERATRHLCDLADAPGDRQRCDDATAAVARAREKIRASCGACP